jgi:subtilisin family serine protease
MALTSKLANALSRSRGTSKTRKPDRNRLRRLLVERMEERRVLASMEHVVTGFGIAVEENGNAVQSSVVSDAYASVANAVVAEPAAAYQSSAEYVTPMATTGDISGTLAAFYSSNDVAGNAGDTSTRAAAPTLPTHHYFVGGKRVDLSLHASRMVFSLGGEAGRGKSVDALQNWEFVRQVNPGYSVYESQGSAARKAASLMQEGAVADAIPVFVISSTNTEAVLIDELIVSLKPEIDAAKFFENNQSFSRYRRLDGTPNQYVATVAAGTGLAALNALNELQSSKPEGVQWIEPNFYQSWTKSYVPNDPRFGNQWHHNNTGQGGSLVDADSDLPEAWDVNRGGSPDYVVGIIDDGVENHPDLRLWSNPGEIPGNSVDDDGNGWVDDINGWNFVSDNNLAGPTTSTDSHGTAVAGVAAATGDNNLGVAGASFNSRVSSARIFEGANVASDANIASALYYMGGRTANGLGTWKSADIVNNSWGGGGNSTAINDALTWGTTAGRQGLGAPYVFASGNGFSGTVSYPSSQSQFTPGVFSIGATNSGGVRSDYSNFGSALDFVAPSNNSSGNFLSIDTTDRTGIAGYNAGAGDPDPDYTGIGSTGFGGTSSATPLVAGITAMVMDQADDLGVTLSPATLRNYLRQTTDLIGGVEYDMATGKNVEYGFGRLNAATAVSGIGKPEISVLASSGELSSGLGSLNVGTIRSTTTKDVMLRVRNQGTSPLNLTSLSVGTGDFSILTGFGDNVLSVGEATTFVIRYAPATPGADSSVVTIVSNDSSEGAFTFTVNAVAVISFPPVANNDRLSTDVDTPLVFNTADLLANDTDDLGVPVFSTLLTTPTNGTLIATGTTGEFRYTPSPGFSGKDSFTYQILDINGQPASATVFLFVGEFPTRLFAFDNAAVNSIIELDPATGNTLNAFPSPVATGFGPDFGMAYADGELFVGGDQFENIYVLDPDTGTTIRTLPNPGNVPVSGLAVINDELFVLNDNDGQIEVVDVITGASRRTLSDGGFEALTAAGGRLLAIDGFTGNLLVMDPVTGSRNAAYPAPFAEGFGVIGNQLFSTNVDSIDVYNLSNGDFLRSITGLGDLEAIGADDPTPLGNFAPFGAFDQFFIDTDFAFPISFSSSQLLSNDLDGDGNTLTFTGIASPPTTGTLTEIAPGQFEYSAPIGTRGLDSFTYTLSDGTATSTGIVFIDLVGNNPPVARADFFTTPVGVALIVHDHRLTKQRFR